MSSLNKGIIVWQCPHCKDVVVSNNWTRHDMNYCKCGKTACDMEEHMVRWFGSKDNRAKYYNLEELLE